MSDFYNLVSFDPSPLSVADFKAYSRIDTADDDALIESMIEAATEFGEKYTARDFRAKEYQLFLDCFSDRIKIRRDPVDTIDSVEHIVNDVFAVVDPSIYYLKSLTQCSELLLKSGESWPTDTDDREQAIEVTFTTAGYYCQEQIIEALKLIVAYMYANRGDCSGGGSGSCSCDNAAKGSGAIGLLDLMTIGRV